MRSSARSTELVSPPITMMPISDKSPSMISFILCLAMKARAAGSRSSIFSFSCAVDHRRMRQPRIIKARRAGELVEAGVDALAVVLGGEFAGGVAGADAQFQHHRRVACFRQLEALFDRAHDRGQIGARIEQPHRGFQRVGVRALLDDAGAFAVVLAEDDHGAADHAGRRQIGERVGGDIGADDRFPGHRAAQGIIDRGAEHGGGGRLVRTGLQMHAEFGHDVLGVHQHVEQMRDRRALIAADVRDARLQQRLGDRENAFAVEGLAVAQPQRLHFLLERAFHQGLRQMVGVPTIYIMAVRNADKPSRRESAVRTWCYC